MPPLEARQIYPLTRGYIKAPLYLRGGTGEIYNYQKLRQDLEAAGHRFRSTSDTEVLLGLYAALGRGMLSKLRGMFAFALWDEQQQGLFLARDPFGIKPLYLADDGKTLHFASQVKALLASDEVDTAPDATGHCGFFALLCLVWVAGHSDLTQVVMGSPDWTTNGEVGSWVNLPATKYEDGNQGSSGPVAAGPGFGGLDERIDRFDTAVGEPGIERIGRLGQCFLSGLATALIGPRRQRRAQLSCTVCRGAARLAPRSERCGRSRVTSPGSGRRGVS